MKLVTALNGADLDRARLIAESNEFAIYDVGHDTYTLVHRHESTQWQGISISGDALFRVGELLARATRALYRDVASELSRTQHGVTDSGERSAGPR